MAKRERAKPARTFAFTAKAGKIRQSSRRKLTKKEAKKATRQADRQAGKMPGSFNLTANTVEILRTHWRILGGIALVYLLVSVLLASGLGNFISALNSVQNQRDISEEGTFTSAFSSFTGLLGNNSQSGSAMQSLLIVILSLAIIWSLRQLLAGKKITIKQAYYQSMFPFIPFALIIFVIIIQLLPITIGTAALGIILSSVFTNDALVTIVTTAVFVLLAAWSVYMLTSSVMALYIVTLPDMHPRDALRSAKNLVRARRWQLMRRLVYLPIFILLTMIIVVVPLILLLPAAAVAIFYLLATLAIFFSHAYLYSLYRSLI